MTESILCLKPDLPAFATILIVPKEDTLSREISWGSDNFKSLPLDLVDFIVFGMWKVVE